MPPVAFYFKVEFAIGSNRPDYAFMEISGLSAGFGMEGTNEGGENGLSPRIPKRVKQPNLVFKRPLVPLGSGVLSDWIKNFLGDDSGRHTEACSISISLLDAKGNKFAAWSVTNAYPVKWKLSPFDARKNELAIEFLEFACHTIERKR